MARKHKEESHANHERWLITYSDLITLLMIFFIIMYSMSQVDAAKFRAVADSLNVTLGGGTPSKVDLATSSSGPSFIDSGSNSQVPGQSSKPPVITQMNPENTPSEGSGQNDLETLTIEGIKTKLDQFAAENNIQTKLVSSIEERGLVVSIQDTLLFASGSADITSAAQNILKKISTVLKASPNYIKVEGHTDNLPIHTAQFPSNWELSVLRATNVLQILGTEGGIDSQRLSATGYGEYRPVADNKTEAGRAANRRVDLVILRSKYELVEPGSSSP
ncbi:MAG: Motility protein B [Candidatus Dichloromethanomonas elyunquensis]|nr:MAG: Motility protein B [Candidatus Dichloromethanomonas elyunquensis]